MNIIPEDMSDLWNKPVVKKVIMITMPLLLIFFIIVAIVLCVMVGSIYKREGFSGLKNAFKY